MQLDVQELLLVVPLVERGRGVEPFVALQADQVGLEHAGHDLGDLGLAHAGVAFDQQRLLEVEGQVHRGRHRRIGDVLGRFHQLLDPGGSLRARAVIVHEAARSRRAYRRRAASASRWPRAPRARAARPPPPARRRRRRGATSSANTSAANSTGVPCVPRYTGATIGLARPLALAQQRGDDVVGQPRLIPEGDERRRRARRQRRGAGRDRRPLPRLRPRIHREAHRQPVQRRPHRRVVVPRHDDEIPDVRQHTPRPPTAPPACPAARAATSAAPSAAPAPPPGRSPAINGTFARMLAGRCSRRRSRMPTPQTQRRRRSGRGRRTSESVHRVEGLLARRTAGAD